jgi:hypothetical protein
VRPQGTNRHKTVDGPAPVTVSFREPQPTPWNLDQWPSPFVIALSCTTTLLVISVLLRIL